MELIIRTDQMASSKWIKKVLTNDFVLIEEDIPKAGSPDFLNLTEKLKNKKSKQSFFYKSITDLLEVRRKQKAFHPNGLRSSISMGPKIFCFKRQSVDKKQIIICITNLSSKTQTKKINYKFLKWKNLLDYRSNHILDKMIKLKPFQTVWLSNI